MRSTYILATMLLAFCSLSGCSSHKKTVGDIISAQSENTHLLGEKWKNGAKLIDEGHDTESSGRDMVKKGKNLIKKGNAKINKGKSMTREGEKMQQQTENTFQLKFPNVLD